MSLKVHQDLRDTVRRIVDALAEYEPSIKTVAYYERVLSRDVRDLYNGEMDREAFIDDMLRLIEEQFRRAWNEGMRDNGLDPQRDMTDEWEAVLQYLMGDELMYVEPFTDAIIQAQQAQEPIDQFLQRVSLWANRYNEVVNYSKMITRPEDRYKWNLGATEKHCSTCSTLNGTVATGQDWLSSGLSPAGCV